MKFKLTKYKKKIKIKKLEPNTLSFECTINDLELSVVNEKIIDHLVLKDIEPELDDLMKRIIDYLEGDDSEDEAALLLDELAHLRSVLSEVEKKLSKAVVVMQMKKIRFIAFELKKRLINYNNDKKRVKKAR